MVELQQARRGRAPPSPIGGEVSEGRGRLVLFLALETSCDETAAAVFTDEPRVLSNVVASQNELHARFHGVVPEIAARAHLRNLLPVIDQALSQANVTLADIGCVAVHNPPGLVGALLIGARA